MLLVIGNKNFSSWSLRPWLLMRHANIPFREEFIPFHRDDTRSRMLSFSPTGRVPVLVQDKTHVWDSLAICETIAEQFPEKKLWPEDAAARAKARSLCAEMHSGFEAMRGTLTFNARARFPQFYVKPPVLADIQRIASIWQGQRREYAGQGEFLFGHFTVADAFFAPVAARFETYNVKLSGEAKAYQQAILSLPAMREWLEAAEAEMLEDPAYEYHAAEVLA